MKIIADSSCDLFELDGVNFETVPLTIYTDERSFLDDRNLNVHEMLDYLASYKGRSYSSCPSTESWINAFSGSDEIFVMTVTSGLSGSYNSAETAKKIYLEDHPDVKISIIDSLSTGGEEIVLLNRLAKLLKSGKTFEDIDHEIREYQKKTRLFFSFFSLHNLAQNGRISKAIAMALGALNISVIGTASSQGVIQVTGKARGEKKSILTLLSELKSAGFKGGNVVITHVENESMAISLKDAILAEFPKALIQIATTRGLCAYYMERRGIVLSFDTI